MSETQTSAATAPAWPILSLNERRVLGVLVEKAKTTPDAYPLSLNSLLTGSNQKSNRDPVMDLTEDDVMDALLSAQKKGLTIRITGSRVERWRHALYEAWGASKVELAILAELLLRGPQTEGELRGRASRMEPVDDLETLRELLKPLVERGLVVYLGPEGRRGTMLTHGLHDPQELKHLRNRHSAEETVSSPAGARSGAAPSAVPSTTPALPASGPNSYAALEACLADTQKEIGDLRQMVAVLQTQVAELSTQVKGLRDALGG